MRSPRLEGIRHATALAVVLAAVALPARAEAKDPPAYALAAEGDLERARASVVAALGEDLSAQHRAAYLELMVVIERWSTAGARPHARLASAETALPESADWNASFAEAREALVAGRYRAATARFATLAKSAPDASSRVRSEALGGLADRIAAHDSARPDVSRAGGAPTDAPEPKTKQWYGWETLICDGASVVTSPILIGIGGYFFCSPIVHLAHGQPIHALASFGTRFSAPITLALGGGLLDAAAQSDGRCELSCGVVGAVVGFGLGIVTAIAIDAAVLARKEVPRTEKKATVVPTGFAASGRMELGVVGTF